MPSADLSRHRARVAHAAICALFCSLAALGQVGDGSITGTATDSSGAIIVGAKIEAANAATGVVYSSATTAAGAYTIAGLPAGSYTITTAVKGFQAYTHPGLMVGATQVLRQDVVLSPGPNSDAITVTAAASLLHTESGELARNLTLQELDALPLLGIGLLSAGPGGIRDPYNTLLTMPGLGQYFSGGTFTMNGLGGFLEQTIRVEGQDATSRVLGIGQPTIGQPGTDAIQEIAYQVSNYAAEYGQAGSMVFSVSMKSGSNQYHGGGFEYFVNEDLNAGDPFTISGGCIKGPLGSACSSQGGDGGKLRPRNRRNDFGGTLGGPISIPKVYDGHNRSFFFFSYEEYLESNLHDDSATVPVPAYLAGDFSAISPAGSCSLCTAYGIPSTPLGKPVAQLDPLGNSIYANEIFDPTTRKPATSGAFAGQGYAAPFLNNTIPSTRFDSVYQRLAALFPAPANPNLLSGNYSGASLSSTYSGIPSVKIDHSIDSKDRISYYYSEDNLESPLYFHDGLPLEIGESYGAFLRTYTQRLNYDRSATPSILLHFGAGYIHSSYNDNAAFLNFDPSTLALAGFVAHRQFPDIQGTSGAGGMQNMGPPPQVANLEERPGGVANVTLVRGKHTFKAGSEMYLDQFFNTGYSGVTLSAGTGPTSEPFQPTSSLAPYSTGFGFASLMLGDFTSTSQSAQIGTRVATQVWALFAQDSWKVRRNLTLDYGIRWDYVTPAREQYGRLGQFDAVTANPSAGGHPGALRYASTCGCAFYQPAYPYAIGPRFGLAYQIEPHTVFRAGWGVTYELKVGTSAGVTVSNPGVYPVAAANPGFVPAAYQYVNIESPNAIVQPNWPVTNPFLYPLAGQTPGTAASKMPFMPDANQNRPPRIEQYSAGFEREITPNLILEASYVGNHAVWTPGSNLVNSGSLGFLSQTSAHQYANYGLYPYPGTGPCSPGPAGRGSLCASPAYNNDFDRSLLGQTIGTGAVIQHEAAAGLTNLLPYAGWPSNTTLQSVLYPYPQFGNLNPGGSPTGDSKYDSLQVRATKRLSHGLQAGGAFTWGQGFTRPTRQDFFNPASSVWALQNIPPRDLTFNFVYATPRFAALPRMLAWAVRDWQIGGFANYQTAAFLTPPITTNSEFLPSEQVRVPGQPLYTPGVNLDDHGTFNPYYTQVLNPKAWAQCPVNTACMGQSNLYKDFRGIRTPAENANLGRTFRIKERMSLSIRGDFVNIFNRTLLPSPFTVNPQNPPAKPLGIYMSGFGIIGAYLPPNTSFAASATPTSAVMQPRSGTVIARFSF